MAVVHRHSVRTSWPQPLQCDSQPVTAIALQITMAVTHRTAGGPAATTRAGGPSAVSEHCAGHCGESRAPSGDHARRRPFCSLWTLRRSPCCSLWTLRRSPFCSLWTQPLQCDSQPVTAIALQITMAVTHRTAGGPAATTRAGGPSAVSEHCAGHCGESRSQ